MANSSEWYGSAYLLARAGKEVLCCGSPLSGMHVKETCFVVSHLAASARLHAVLPMRQGLGMHWTLVMACIQGLYLCTGGWWLGWHM